MRLIQVHTDGACKRNPGPGGWGFILQVVEKGNVTFLHCSYGHPSRHTTNNEMELTAIYEALLFIKNNVNIPKGKDILPLQIFTDSQYAVNCLSKWVKGWEASGWKTAVGKPVKNAELLKKILAIDIEYCPTYHWIERSSDPRNVEADRLANLGVEQYLGGTNV